MAGGLLRERQDARGASLAPARGRGRELLGGELVRGLDPGADDRPVAVVVARVERLGRRKLVERQALELRVRRLRRLPRVAELVEDGLEGSFLLVRNRSCVS